MLNTQPNTIELIEVSKTFGSTVALQPTSLSVRKGEFLTLLGPSGSGKTTLLNLICGAHPVSSGKILLNGKDLTNAPPRDRGVAMVFQNYALMPHMTAFDNVAYPLKVRGYPKSEIRTKVKVALAQVGLSGFENRKPKQLSGGQQQRVGIARCIVYSPDIIIMDEPLGALDKNLREQMQDEIKILHNDLGTTFIYVTHDQEEALNMSDTICLMRNGAVEQLGTPDELYFSPISRFAAQFIGESNLFEGVMNETGGLKLDSGYVVSLPHAHTSKPGSRCEAMLRPERISIASDDGPARDADLSTPLSGIVENVSFVGSVVRLSVQLDKGPLMKVRATSQTSEKRYRVGQPLRLRWNPEDVAILKRTERH